MKFLFGCLNVILVFCLFGCESEIKHYESFGIDSIQPNDGTLKVNIKYRKPVNGYEVSVVCLVDTLYNKDILMGKTNAIYGKAYLHFKKDKTVFIIQNISFADPKLMNNVRTLNDGEIVELDYTPYTATDSLAFSNINTPFFFWDIDFDGEKELISTVFDGMGYSGHSSYDVYKIPQYGKHAILHKLNYEPFNEIDDYTEIDSINKMIIIPYGIGLRYAGVKKYGLIGTSTISDETIKTFLSNKWMLMKIEQYDYTNSKPIIINSINSYTDPEIIRYRYTDGEFRQM